ncbi:hypothetical protein H6G97_31790 [Nostoc flagelliforme FACHB-838]|uniref:Uncharacterized protein n=1 Tax=Nostoc flagelliforme FACHB-838 TaxID=2692904 RepID=A0ABR8DWZ2_9NOSO|nr:hypothetical protein [Nostoc flagelliforme]MBD2533886.1 hypothetical protein [Nostoc flagelliforme FACHB-838]
MISPPARRKSLGARCLLIKRNWDDLDHLPFELLRNISRIGLASNNDSQGNETSLVVQEKLPQAKIIAPKGQSWNEVFVRERRQQQEIVEQKQRSRGFSW